MEKVINWQLHEGHTIVPAFTVGGVQYYGLQDSFNTFTERGFQALAVYDEWNNRMTNEHLKAFIDVMYENMSGANGKIDLMNISQLVIMIKERLEWIVPTADLLYKMAGVAFFDEHESPYIYDAKYAEKKIKFWKENVDKPEVFFCNVPIHLRHIFPLPTISQQDLETCLEVIGKIEKKQLEKTIGMTSNADLRKILSMALN